MREPRTSTRTCRCSKCSRTEADGARFGVNPYQCLDCVAARIRDYRARKKAAAAESVESNESAPTAEVEVEVEQILVGAPMDSRDLMVRVERHLADGGETWIGFATRAEIAPGVLHGIISGRGPERTDAETAAKILSALR
ncbi:hypothetical protein [Miltoncostaea oceani]|uniref:hypothetical protein n=1 Tax=Miltoncostaea oceani TaxID=2843216 RepID=UPI001C3E6DDD|nr:hypothetical protein [Miltoncostaea oceani]